jgi:hypothetical protein
LLTAAFEQAAAALAEAVGLPELLPPEPLLPQAARLVPMATAATAIMMRRIGNRPYPPGSADRAH